MLFNLFGVNNYILSTLRSSYHHAKKINFSEPCQLYYLAIPKGQKHGIEGQCEAFKLHAHPHTF